MEDYQVCRPDVMQKKFAVAQTKLIMKALKGDSEPFLHGVQQINAFTMKDTNVSMDRGRRRFKP
jgi:hypothetical protein